MTLFLGWRLLATALLCVASCSSALDLSPAPALSLLPRGAPSFLARGRSAAAGAEAPQVCADIIPGWRDVLFNSCDDYGEKQYCTANGGYGPGWHKETWGTFSAYAFASETAPEVCCACGSGKLGDAASCSTLRCPQGFSSKADAASLYCKGFKCKQEVEFETCCEAPPDVQVAVNQVKATIAELKEEVKNTIDSEGATMLQSLADSAERSTQIRQDAMKTSWGAARQQAIDRAKGKFASLTEHSDQLFDAAKYQISSSGYLAAKDEVENGKVTIDKHKLQVLAHELTESFGEDVGVWKSAVKKGAEVQQLSQQEWASHHAELNATWPLILRGITELNTALSDSEAPANEVRWVEQSARLASDIIQVAKSQATGLMQQAEAAEDRSNAALSLTGSNSGKLDQLEALVDKVSES
mmetsp:Transcript_39221/g.101700  ORF Transcript_39221/g.101700 Transcript_39221/m.101700 type:complete len:413 (-) Transcript_39221:78-1316(-)